MVKKRLIPKLLLKRIDKNFITVSTQQFLKHKIVGDPVSQAKIYESQLADELVIIFIDNNIKLKNNNIKNLLHRMSSETFMPLTIGGGIKSLDDVKFLMDNGSDKILINKQAYLKPKIISEIVKVYGSQSVVISIDYVVKKNEYFIKIKNKFIRINMSKYLKKLEVSGAGEVLLTNINLDGSERGLDISSAKKFSKELDIPLLISGGCGLSKHFQDCFLKTDVEGIASGTFFAFRDQNPLQTRSQIKNSGINIRIR